MQGLDTVLKYFDDFSPTQLQQFAALESLYKEWNEKINVVSRKDIDQIYLHHVLHSLSIAAIANFKPGADIIDIGCGGGFPGVPLVIFFLKQDFTWLTALAKN
jgi:16S rRNA (guanine527-N7)-methyltransferase